MQGLVDIRDMAVLYHLLNLVTNHFFHTLNGFQILGHEVDAFSFIRNTNTLWKTLCSLCSLSLSSVAA